MSEEINEYSKHYSEENFLKKVLKFGKRAGIQVVYAALLLFYVLQKPEVPIAIKGVIIGALGYFIFPLDLIADMVPGVGYADDLGAIAAALAATALYIDKDVKEKAKQKLRDLFGNYEEDDLGEIGKKY